MSLPPELGLPKHFVAKQTRCVYGTRDAGMIWEQCYRDALENIGFVSGVSNPCLFHHPTRDLTIVVHGDDFTALGTDHDLDWYTAELEKVFEIKVRGRLGEGTADSEIRILNRIVRVTPEGVRFEADPRHLELLARSLGLEGASSVLTPGVKPSAPEHLTFKGDENSATGQCMDSTGRVCEAIINADGTTTMTDIDNTETLRGKTLESIIQDIDNGQISEHCKSVAVSPTTKSVSFTNAPAQTADVVAYSEIYGRAVNSFVFDAVGLKPVSSDVDPYTGKTALVMKDRINKYVISQSQSRERRRAILKALLRYQCTPTGQARAQPGSVQGGIVATDPYTVRDTEMITDGIGTRTDADDYSMHAARTVSTKNKYQKRKGAKAVKQMERLESTSFALSPGEATLYRALSARANYLAQDRPDIAFSTKELCREFAIPNKDSYQKLKRVCRYLIGLPRLVYVYGWQSLPDAIDIFTDTDFAGDKISRRSTSGGTVMFGAHNIRHWATTQTTLSLSSGEAELHGIGKGIQHALGLRSLFKDMGMDIKLRVHSDATAAIGIARRRGLGKLRHLDTEDLWIQSKIRSKDIQLLKVLGAINPADVLTKYIDAKTLAAALKTMGLEREEGRPESAPAAAQ